jgi:uncharacterized membrane protein YczE
MGIVANLYSGLGMNPWGVLNVGIINHVNLTLGQVSQIIGLVVLILGWYMGFPPGFGTFMNMYFVGYFIDIIIKYKFLPKPTQFIWQLLMLFFSVIILGIGSFFYLNPKLGAGPRDGLMMGLVQRYNLAISHVRGAIELTVLVGGYFLGGPVGLGTLISALTVGYSVQLAFKIGGYDKMAPHMNLYYLLEYLKEN